MAASLAQAEVASDGLVVVCLLDKVFIGLDSVLGVESLGEPLLAGLDGALESCCGGNGGMCGRGV